MAPQLCPFYVPGTLRSFSSFFARILAPFWFEEITTGKTGNTRGLRSGHKTNWLLAFEALPVFPVVIFRHIRRDRTQGWPPNPEIPRQTGGPGGPAGRKGMSGPMCFET